MEVLLVSQVESERVQQGKLKPNKCFALKSKKKTFSAFTKPVVGLFDMASNVTAGIRETTTVFETGQLTRERLPRYSGKDGIVTVSKRNKQKKLFFSA